MRLQQHPVFQKTGAAVLDLVMCAAMNGIQWRHRVTRADRDALERYVAHCETLTREIYYSAPFIDAALSPDAPFLRWWSPISTPVLPGRHAAAADGTRCVNDRAHVDLFPCAAGWSAPTAILLHALMSAGDTGYRRWAQRFNARGWNACFVHLPYHFSRTPPGFLNGELAITADLVRTGEGLRSGVVELRQLMAGLRGLGTREFGLWATSYGGWIGALLSFLESDFRWVALMTPILNVEHAIWKCAATAAVRFRLRQAGIDHSFVARHAHLTSPLDGRPLCGGRRVIFGAGEYDSLSPRREMVRLAKRWGSEMLAAPQGHFGLRLMPAIFDRLVERGDI